MDNKGQSYFFSMGALHAMIKARFGTKIAGHWVTMTNTISGIRMMAMSYAWRQKGISYFLLTCGSTEVSSVLYLSAFEDEFGNVDYKFLPHPQIDHFTFEYLPLIDENNKQRQAVWGLERKWPTQCCWTRLIVTLMGMCVIDMQRLYRREKKLRNIILCGQILEEDTIIVKFSDLLCSGLIDRDRNNTSGVQHRVSGTENLLARIGKEGEINLPVTEENKARGKLTGQPFQRKCYVCRKYLKADDKVCYCDTSYWCKHCKMPLCNKDRRQPELGLELTCEGEHICPSLHVFGCSGKSERGFHQVVPEEEQVNIYPRRRGRSAATAPASNSSPVQLQSSARWQNQLTQLEPVLLQLIARCKLV
jgi:hypothetical protein